MRKSSLQPIGHSSCTRDGWFRLSPIDQYSSLLPPVESGPCLSTSVGDLPLRTPRHRSLGRPLPYQPANVTHAHPLPPKLLWLHHAAAPSYGVLIRLSTGYPPVKGRLHTRYSPVRRSLILLLYPSTCM